VNKAERVEGLRRRYLQTRIIHVWNGYAPLTEPPRARIVLYASAATDIRDGEEEDNSTIKENI
jgi:hypothetical protein